MSNILALFIIIACAALNAANGHGFAAAFCAILAGILIGGMVI